MPVAFRRPQHSTIAASSVSTDSLRPPPPDLDDARSGELADLVQRHGRRKLRQGNGLVSTAAVRRQARSHPFEERALRGGEVDRRLRLLLEHLTDRSQGEESTLELSDPMQPPKMLLRVERRVPPGLDRRREDPAREVMVDRLTGNTREADQVPHAVRRVFRTSGRGRSGHVRDSSQIDRNVKYYLALRERTSTPRGSRRCS
jgi:hypothetical protein